MILKSFLRISIVLLPLALISPALGQTSQSGKQLQAENQSEDDPTRAVFFSVREEYRSLKNGAWNNRLIVRKDVATLKGGRFTRPRGLLLRTDIPITTTHLGGDTQAGLGDIYGQVLYIPYLSRSFGLAVGTGLFIPTATSKTLGLGKWQIAPLAVPVWFLPRARGFFLVKFQEAKSFAGPSGRPDLNYFLITPAFFYRVAKRWWIQADAESLTDWTKDNQTNFRVGLQVGRVINPKFALAVKPEIPFGGRRPGDWTIKITWTWYRQGR
ncbi:MAG TPA: hypothetical protein VKM94_07445 [Blastocatellia bacterium]|nr:hypothetical protein [Blastocatellia bacterium]